jgi:hypothetical protein
MSYVRYVKDSLHNFVTGLGQWGIDRNKAVEFTLWLLDRATLENMYRGDWLARAIVDAPAEDMTREWRAWQASQQQIEAIESIEKTMDIRRKVRQWISKARLYGGAALVIGVDDGNDPSQALDLEKCKKGCLKYVVVLHRWELNAGPRIYNVLDPYYTRAAYYTVATPMFGFQGETGTTYPTIPGQKPQPPPGSIKGFITNFASNVIPFGNRQKGEPGGRSPAGVLQNYPYTTPTNIGLTQIHPSRILELPGLELPDWRLAPLGGGWGDSVLQTVVDTLQSFIQSSQSIASIVSDGKLDIVKIPDMALRLKNTDYKNRLLDRFTLSAQTKSVISALLLDKEEEWERVNTQYAGLPMILHEFLTLVAGAAGIPVSRIFGTAMGQGLHGGATSGGPDDLRNYYDHCANQQKNEIAPRLGMLDQVMMRSAFGTPDPNMHYEWNPLWQLSDGEKADIALKKAQATQIYATNGILNEDALRRGVVNQLIEDGIYPGLDAAIDEFGEEPEEPELGIGGTGGYGPGELEQPEVSPNPEELGHTGSQGE